VLQFLSAAGSQGASTGIAWWAHIGGFVLGIVFLKLFQVLPSAGIKDRLSPMTAKKTSDRLQVIHPSGSGDSPHLFGALDITPHEASSGTRKVVNIPWGFYTRLIRVTVPPGVVEGSSLRLRGLGRRLPDGERGDLYLKLRIR
jgi:hypothetical protein